MNAVAEREVPVLSQLLDQMEVTDRLFHDLDWAGPLVDSILATLTRVKPSGSILAVAPNALLARALVDAGYQVEVWQHELSLSDPATAAAITRRGSMESLLGHVEGGPFDAVVLPYALDRVLDHPTAVLARLRGVMAPHSVLVIAHVLPGGFHARHEAFSGRAMPPDPISRPQPLNYAWFPIPLRRTFAAHDLGVWAMKTGFALAEHRQVLDRKAVNRIVPMRLMPWLRARISYAAQKRIPGLRECGLAILVNRPGPFIAMAEGLDFPMVSIMVTSAPAGRLGACLESLGNLAYPAERMEILLAGGDAARVELARTGLAARVVDMVGTDGLDSLRLLAEQAVGDVFAITDGYSRLPRGWIDVGINRLTAWTSGIRGPVWPDSGSAGPFLTLPGRRPEVGGGGWFGASNLIVRKEVLAQVLESHDDGPWEGWESELGCRLAEAGLGVEFTDHAKVTRLFPFPARRGWIKTEYEQAKLVPQLIARRPQLGAALQWGVFASRRTLGFDVLILSLILAAVARQPWFLLGSLVWLFASHRHMYLWPPSRWVTTVRHLRGMGARGLVWLAGLLVGSFKARRLVL
ncbi:MAG TPA: hypothetical protein VG015_07310 [Candidatus Dormibacteraeota bacterium]|jgi:hypothetical protein|nr:hypothetical protein [Candidatus Dormibacteraeota bacterium]